MFGFRTLKQKIVRKYTEPIQKYVVNFRTMILYAAFEADMFTDCKQEGDVNDGN